MAVSTAEVTRLPLGLCSLANPVTNLGTISIPSSVIHSKRGDSPGESDMNFSSCISPLSVPLRGRQYGGGQN